MNGVRRRSSCLPNHLLGHEADGGVAKVVMPLAAHPLNMVVATSWTENVWRSPACLTTIMCRRG
jgi:hypothetical protein